jgi:hypothetical protein
MIEIRFLKRKRKEVKVDPKLGGQWNVKGKTPFHFFPLPPQQPYLNLQFFSFDLEVLFYHGDRSLFTP